MPPDNQISFLNRISIRRNQFFLPDQDVEEQDLFQKHISDRFSDLLSSTIIPGNASATDPSIAGADSPAEHQEEHPQPSPPLTFLSLAWYRKLVDVFLCCEAEFKAVLISGRDPSQFSKPPMDRLITDLLERFVKALDICNAITHGIDLIQNWLKLARIAVAALRHAPPLGEGQARRAQKALTMLLSSLFFDDRENTSNNFHIRWKDRTRSFSRRFAKERFAAAAAGNGFRSLSWSVAKSWSASKQIQNMSSNLVVPRGADASGPATPVFIMNTVLVFVMWALLAGIPCQERNGLASHFQIPRQLNWAQGIISLQEKINEEWKKKEKKGTAGLLEEVQQMEKVAQSLMEHTTSFVFPMDDEKAAEIDSQVVEMEQICKSIEEDLSGLQLQVREIFHRLVRSRSEILDDVVDQITKMSTPVPY